MAQVYNKMKIDIKKDVTDIITAKQNDSNSRFLDVYLYDSGVPLNLTGHEVRIYMRKPDGKEVFNNGQITEATSGRCQFELTDQALGAVGKLLCEISVWKNNTQILTTQTFDIFVTESLRTSGSIESSNEYGALVVLYQNLYEAIDLMQTMVEQFGQPGTIANAAKIATFWQMLEYLYDVNADALANASVQGVINLIGSTKDTGGSASAGTLMAKENAAIGYLANSTYGLSALKNQIVKNQNWYAKAGTDITLVSLPAVTSESGKEVRSAYFVAPESGIYTFNVSMSRVHSEDFSIILGCNLILKSGVLDLRGLNMNAIVADNIIYKTNGSAGTYSGSATFEAYLEKGYQYYLESKTINSANGIVTKINSATIKYVKQVI